MTPVRRGLERLVVAAAVIWIGVGQARAEAWSCSPWEWVHPQPFPLRLAAVVARGGELWGFGESGVAVSADGVQWQRKSLASGKLSAVLWTGEEFLGTAGNTVVASRDGITWQVRHEVWQDPIFFTIQLRSLATGAGRYVAVGEDFSGRFSMWSPVLLTSADGVVWSRGAIPPAADPSHSTLAAVIWAKGRFVAVGSYLLTSPDGESWSADERVQGQSLASDGTVVVVAGETELSLSTDFASWQVVPSPVQRGRVRWAGGRFWLAGPCAACPDQEPSLWSSADARTWRRARLDAPLELRDVVATAGRFVAVGNGAAVSFDGESWQTSLAGLATGLAAVASGGGRVVAVGQSGELLVSEGGGPWRRVLWGGAARLADVASSSAGFVVVGEGVSLVSRDGIAWSAHPTPDGVALSRVVAEGSRFVAASWDGGLFVSADGATWSAVSLESLGFPISFFPDLAVGNGVFLASLWRRDEGGAIIASSDGINWTKVADTRSGLPELVWGGGRFLATDFGSVLASPDGTHWQEVSREKELVGLQWAGDRFVAWDRDGSFFESTDGSQWRPTSGPAGEASTSEGGVLWRVTAEGAVQRSTCGPPAASLLLPSLAHLPGANGTVWRSDVELYNPGAEAIVVGLAAVPRGERAAAGQVALTLPAGTAVRLDDALASWLGVEEAATLQLASWGGSVLAAARTYNETAAGTFGQFIPPYLPGEGVGAGGEARLLHLAHAADRNTGFRTNLGLVSVGTEPATVDLELRDGEGALVGLRRAEVPAGVSVQLNDVFREFTSGDLGTAVAVARPLHGSVLTYASVVDNRSGDPIFVRPARRFEVGESAWVPGAGHLAGIGGSLWRTDVELHNPGETAISCTVELFPRGVGGGPQRSITVSVPAGASRRLADVVGDGFGWEGAATLRVRAAGGGVMVGARTYAASSAGSYGQYVAALGEGEAVTASSPGQLVMLRQAAAQAAGFRTNLGLVNVTAVSAVVEVELRRASGTLLGVARQELGPLESVQLTEVLRVVAAGEVEDAVATVRTTTAGAAILAYACLIDNRTHDPVFVPAVLQQQPLGGDAARGCLTR